MKFVYILFLSIIMVSLSGCRKDFEQIQSFGVIVQLTYPDAYNDGFFPSNVPVAVKNNTTGQVFEGKTDEKGQLYMELIPGIYAVTASKAYSPEEGLAITGYEQEFFVNANISPLVVTEEKTIHLKLNGSKSGSLVIREFYYSGVPTGYFYDLFVEIYNNSNADVRVDSLYLGNTKAASASTYGFTAYTQDTVYLAQVFMVPHEGVPRYLKPGESLVVAMDGINHKDDPLGNSKSPVNLGPGIADFETYWPYTNRDSDAPDVPNLFHAYYNSTAGFDWLPGVGGSGLVIFNTPDLDGLPVMKEPGTSAATQFKGMPVSDVIDGVETVSNSNITVSSKRLPVGIDAGMTTVGATYNGRSVRRKIKGVIDGRTIFVDTNNSSADFEVNLTPSPRKWN